ncbi:hypothetical protein LTR85_001550 [Meristemomyces frigidus]|nr:hypothetical protein LTR85_001550 [Meristemomyces frigidus]
MTEELKNTIVTSRNDLSGVARRNNDEIALVRQSLAELTADDTTPVDDAEEDDRISVEAQLSEQKAALEVSQALFAQLQSLLQDEKIERLAVGTGKLSREDTSWTDELGPEWQPYIYTVNDTSAPLHKTRNKGRKANAYLTYIIAYYHALPELSVFVHAHRKGYPQAWHTEGIGNDIVDSLRRLNTAYVQAEGYANLRCNHSPGCNLEGRVQPSRHVNDTLPVDRDAATELASLDAWPELFPGVDVPADIASACCAQFTRSTEHILKTPLEEYQRYHEWLMETKMSDDISRRVMEYAWHIIFGMEVVQ